MTTDYTDFDALLIDAIKSGRVSFHRLLAAGHLMLEANKLATPDWLGNRYVERVVDNRLQSLRKRGVLEYNSKTGWRVVA